MSYHAQKDNRAGRSNCRDTTTRQPNSRSVPQMHQHNGGIAKSQPQFKKNSGGLSKVVKLIKSASEEKETFAGKRKPLGNLSNGNRLLQSKAASKRELQKIQSKLPEIC
mmetsp:Transcript_25358/g.45748  ORF Transcript_25358/g.45748 Transcript_25358/m.45748 type:complete len:109 (-) Transcript_25358:133-459(-)